MVLVLLAVLLIPTHAFAYTFSVKVVNKTGERLWLGGYVEIDAKGGGFAWCKTSTDPPPFSWTLG